MKNRIGQIIAVTLVTALSSAQAASVSWVGSAGGGDDTSFGDADNWSPAAEGGAGGLANLADDYIVDDAGASIGPVGVLTWAGGSLTLLNGTISGANGFTGDGSTTLTVNGGSMTRQFISNGTALSLGGTGTMTLTGGNDPVAGSTIDFTSSDSTLLFTNETPNAFRTEHLAKVTVNGITAYEGINLSVAAFNGASGSEVTALTESFGQKVLEGGPEAYYAFTDTAGPINDFSGNGHSGAVSGGPTFGATGLVNDALAFDGNDSVNGGAILNPNAGDFSIEMVIKATDLSGGGNRLLVQQTDSGGTGRSLLFLAADGEIASFYGNETSGSGYIASEDEWLHIVLTVDDNGANDLLSIYINGLLESTNVVNGETSNGNWLLGTNKSASGNFFVGLFDEFAVYSRLLSADEVLVHARAAGIPTPAALPAGLGLMALTLTRRKRRSAMLPTGK